MFPSCYRALCHRTWKTFGPSCAVRSAQYTQCAVYGEIPSQQGQGPKPLASKKKVSKPPPQAQKPKQVGAEEGEKKKRQRRRQRTVDGADSGKVQ